MKRFLLHIALLLTAGIPLRAADGETVMPLLGIPRDAASLGAAGTGSASPATAAWAAFGNPAVTPFYENKGDLGAGWQHWMPTALPAEHFLAGGTLKAGGRVGLSFGAGGQVADSYTVLDAYGHMDGRYTPYDLFLHLGCGVRVGSRIGLGATLKYLRSALAEGYAMNAFAADLGFVLKAGDFHFSLQAKNLGPQVESGENRYPLPSSAQIGADWARSFGRQRLQADLEGEAGFHGGLAAALGLRFTFLDHFSLRAGGRLAQDEAPLPSCVTLGAGLEWAGFRLDVAWVTAHEFLKNTLAVGLAKSF